jgi:hypothetical protein
MGDIEANCATQCTPLSCSVCCAAKNDGLGDWPSIPPSTHFTLTNTKIHVCLLAECCEISDGDLDLAWSVTTIQTAPGRGSPESHDNRLSDDTHSKNFFPFIESEFTTSK